MHDELDYSTNGETRTARIVDVMTNVVQLRVPSVVDVGLGETWGDAA
jgi:DNA polymerase I-like protein with 3'-5' exonuclease and polymerase domains